MTYKRLKVSCLDCKKEISKSNFNRHIDSATCINTNCVKRINCEFCNQEFERIKSHEGSCKLNPNRKTKKYDNASNQFIHAAKTGAEYVVTEQTRIKMSNSLTGRIHSEETKEKMQIAALNNVKKYPENYRGRYNRGYVKSIICSNGFIVLGSWEQKFIEYCIKNNIPVEQPNIGFSYIFEDKERTYFPDFYLPNIDTWVEIKGYKTDTDIAKWYYIQNRHNKKLLIIDKTNIHNFEVMVPSEEFESSIFGL